MGIKTTQPENVSWGRKYPYIGKSHHCGLIVLFTKGSTGTALISTEDHNTGDHRADWNEAEFSPLVGYITLENE